MTVRRIVANVATPDIDAATAFYQDLLGLEVVMDHGWIRTLAAPGQAMTPQVSFASEGGNGTAVPELSIEVDDVEAVHVRATAMGLETVYGPTDEPWGVRRFFLRDPLGRLVNILSHRA